MPWIDGGDDAGGSVEQDAAGRCQDRAGVLLSWECQA